MKRATASLHHCWWLWSRKGQSVQQSASGLQLQYVDALKGRVTDNTRYSLTHVACGKGYVSFSLLRLVSTEFCLSPATWQQELFLASALLLLRTASALEFLQFTRMRQFMFLQWEQKEANGSLERCFVLKKTRAALDSQFLLQAVLHWLCQA